MSNNKDLPSERLIPINLELSDEILKELKVIQLKENVSLEKAIEKSIEFSYWHTIKDQLNITN